MDVDVDIMEVPCGEITSVIKEGEEENNSGTEIFQGVSHMKK